MFKEEILLGITGIIIGVSIYFKTSSILPSLVPTFLGIGLIFFYKRDELVKADY